MNRIVAPNPTRITQFGKYVVKAKNELYSKYKFIYDLPYFGLVFGFHDDVSYSLGPLKGSWGEAAGGTGEEEQESIKAYTYVS